MNDEYVSCGAFWIQEKFRNLGCVETLRNWEPKMQPDRQRSSCKNFARHGASVISPSRSMDSSNSRTNVDHLDSVTVMSSPTFSLAGSLSKRSLKWLPSLALSSASSRPLTVLEFAATKPICRRNNCDLFGMDG
jgi:hypothetical protein